MIASAALIFGIGVGNAGTAMRHRQKLIPLFLVTLAVIVNCSRKKPHHTGNEALNDTLQRA